MRVVMKEGRRRTLCAGLLFLLATLCLIQALAAHGGFVGIALLYIPRGASLPLALLGLGLAGAALAVRPQALVRSVLVGLLVGAGSVVLVSACTRVYPDRRFLPQYAGSLPEAPYTVTALAQEGGTLWIEPRSRSTGVVVLVHGTGNDRLFGFWYLIEALVMRGYSVLTANLPGHGRGGSDLFELSACRARLDALAVQARQRGGPIYVLGQSLGGSLVLDAAARQAGFDGFIAVSAPLEVHVGSALLRELGALVRPAAYRALRYGTIADVLPAAGSFRRDEFPVRISGENSYVHAISRAVMQLSLAERLAALPASAAPVLLVHGEQDGVVPFAQALRTRAALKGRADALYAASLHHLDPLFDEALVGSVLDWLDACAAVKQAEKQPEKQADKQAMKKIETAHPRAP